MDTKIYLRAISLDDARPIPPEHYLSTLPVISHLAEMQSLPFDAPVTFLVGENGVGKSTLLEAIAVAWGLNPEGGSRNFHFSTAQAHSPLHEHLRLIRGVMRPKDSFFLRAESFFNVATNIDAMDSEPSFGPPVIDSYGGVSLHERSHGESFLDLVMHRFGGQGLYLLDEPEAALSPSRQLSLLTLIHELVQKRSQFVISTHSPILMAYPGAKIYELSQAGISSAALEETEHFLLNRLFYENPKRMIHDLLSDEEK